MMKSLVTLAACVLATGGISLAQLVTGNELVRVDVRVDTGSERKDLAKTTTDEVTQKKTLFITLSGKAKAPETRTGKWIAYGSPAKDGDVTVIESGDFKVDLNGAVGNQLVESKVITTTHTPEHTTVERKRNNRTKQYSTRTKKVAASGTKFAGYAVVIKDGEKVVGEFYEPPGLKEQVKK